MAYQMAAMAVTLNDLEGHSLVAGLFKCNPSYICAAFLLYHMPIMPILFIVCSLCFTNPASWLP